jgi:hypothetical protein
MRVAEGALGNGAQHAATAKKPQHNFKLPSKLATGTALDVHKALGTMRAIKEGQAFPEKLISKALATRWRLPSRIATVPLNESLPGDGVVGAQASTKGRSLDLSRNTS